jgi:hypothetical protein
MQTENLIRSPLTRCIERKKEGWVVGGGDTTVGRRAVDTPAIKEKGDFINNAFVLKNK